MRVYRIVLFCPFLSFLPFTCAYSSSNTFVVSPDTVEKRRKEGVICLSEYEINELISPRYVRVDSQQCFVIRFLVFVFVALDDEDEAGWQARR